VRIEPKEGIHLCGAQSGQKESAPIFCALEEKEYGGSPSGGKKELILFDGLAILQVDISLGHLMRSLRRIFYYSPFVTHTLHIFNQEEIKQLLK
jgi:hypothetical protein